MNIAIIGASAGLGFEVLKRALNRNHKVTALSRSAIKLKAGSSFRHFQGSATDKTDLRQSILGADAVIVTLGTRKGMQATTLFSDFAELAIQIQEEEQMQVPFIFVTGFGAGESRYYVSWFVNLFLKYFLKEVYEDKTKMEEIIAHSTMNWIIVRPGRLLDKEATGNYRIENSLFKGIKIGGINRSDLADFLLDQAERPSQLKKYVAISGK